MARTYADMIARLRAVAAGTDTDIHGVLAGLDHVSFVHDYADDMRILHMVLVNTEALTGGHDLAPTIIAGYLKQYDRENANYDAVAVLAELRQASDDAIRQAMRSIVG